MKKDLFHRCQSCKSSDKFQYGKKQKQESGKSPDAVLLWNGICFQPCPDRIFLFIKEYAGDYREDSHCAVAYEIGRRFRQAFGEPAKQVGKYQVVQDM